MVFGFQFDERSFSNRLGVDYGLQIHRLRVSCYFRAQPTKVRRLVLLPGVSHKSVARAKLFSLTETHTPKNKGSTESTTGRLYSTPDKEVLGIDDALIGREFRASFALARRNPVPVDGCVSSVAHGQSFMPTPADRTVESVAHSLSDSLKTAGDWAAARRCSNYAQFVWLKGPWFNAVPLFLLHKSLLHIKPVIVSSR